MALIGDVRRLGKMAREVLFRETLREFQGESEMVLGVIDRWRYSRKTTDSEIEHYALAARDCSCSVCEHVHQVLQLVRTEIPSRLEAAVGEAWIGDMLDLVERRAPGMAPADFKRSMRLERAWKGWTDGEFLNYIHTGEVPPHSAQYFRTKSIPKVEARS